MAGAGLIAGSMTMELIAQTAGMVSLRQGPCQWATREGDAFRHVRKDMPSEQIRLTPEYCGSMLSPTRLNPQDRTRSMRNLAYPRFLMSRPCLGRRNGMLCVLQCETAGTGKEIRDRAQEGL